MTKRFKILAAIVAILGIAAIAWAGTPEILKYGARLADEGAAHSTPPSGYGELYVNSDVLYYINDSGSATALTAGSGDNTLDNAYDQGGAGSGKAITTDSGAVALSNTDADNAFQLTINASPSGAAAAGGAQITIGANSTQDALEFANSGTGYDIYGSGGTWTMSKAGALACTSATVSGALSAGSFYQAAIASAVSGNTNLTIDAAGTGTIAIGSTSTGAVSVTPTFNATGDVNIGNAATDTLTITAIIDDDLTLDDGTGASPSLILKDATDETATFSKVDGSHVTVTPNAATESFQVLTGNLMVGNGVPGTAAMDGEDFYVNGDSEFDGTVTFDGIPTINAALTLANGLTLDNAANNVLEINENSEDLLFTFEANSIDVSSTTGVASISFFDGSASALTKAANGAADDFTLSVTGAQDSSLILSSTGTAADAMQFNTTAGGILATTAGAMANQFKVDATGVVAGYAIVLETTDGGLQINADGAVNGDITVDAANVLTLITPDPIVVEGGTASVVFEGATANDFETTVAIEDPTADRTITLPDYTGAVPIVIGQDYTQTEQAGAGTADVTGSSITLADGWFTEGKTLKYTVGGAVTGANAAISVALYFEDGAVCTLQTANGAAGDWEAEFIVVAEAAAAQRIIGKLIAEAGAEVKVDYATDNSDTAAVGTIPVKLQITSGNAGDTITAEYVRIDYWNKAN